MDDVAELRAALERLQNTDVRDAETFWRFQRELVELLPRVVARVERLVESREQELVQSSGT